MFDPSLPADHSPNSAVEMRGQLNGLKELIDATPGVTSAGVDSVTTVGPGEAASVTISFVAGVVRLGFAIPRGTDGQPRLDGQAGQPGQPGQQGPPFANAVIDSVGTLNPGDNATVSVTFDGSSVHFSFGIPRGATGEQGIQGMPGEVTNGAMASAISSAIADTARNPSASGRSAVRSATRPHRRRWRHSQRGPRRCARRW